MLATSSPLTTDTGIGTSCATSSMRRAVTTTPFSDIAPGSSVNVDRRRLPGLEHNPAHRRFEPVQYDFEPVGARARGSVAR